MTIAELKTILANRIAVLSSQRGHAVTVGDLLRVAQIDAEVAETETTLAALDTL
jgi:hypothetical protein